MTKAISSHSRRRFLQSAAAASTMVVTSTSRAPTQQSPSLPHLKPLGERVRPIAPEEFHARLVHAHELMSQLDPNFEALLFGPGTSLYYFTGIRWGLSERLLALVLPRKGQPFLVSPAFEESRVHELMRDPLEIRVWQEDESPSKIIAGSLADRGIRLGRVGIEETLPFTFYDHFRSAAPAFECISADPVTVACRAVKSPQELELMRVACEATCDVYREVFFTLNEGVTEEEVVRVINAGYTKTNLRGYALVLFGASAALPHGTRRPQTLREGQVILIDGGCSVDDAARTVITSAGYGPDYKFFTHRLGHGIGLDGHEHPYLVRTSKTALVPRMTFSNEPGIYVPGEFGVRCEDVMVIAADGPAQILTPGFQVSLEKPMGA